jgi:hypothetical protein
MNPTLTAYLTVRQYNAICRYWRLIEMYKSKIAHIDYSRYSCYEESDDEDYIAECVRTNTRLDNYMEKLGGLLAYYEQAYVDYVDRIGYKFNDQTQDEHLFNLLNNGLS